MKSRGAPLCSVRLIRRSPCGERGLKYPHTIISPPPTVWSLPVRGAWVEMLISADLRKNSRVAPRAGSVG